MTNYKYIIQDPLFEHRDEMAKKNKNRIDYVDIGAYGQSKVNVDNPDGGQPTEDGQTVDDPDAYCGDAMQANAEKRLFDRIRGLEKRAEQLGYSLGSLAVRQDERMSMATQQTGPDAYQASLTRKIFGQEPHMTGSSSKARRSHL